MSHPSDVVFWRNPATGSAPNMINGAPSNAGFASQLETYPSAGVSMQRDNVDLVILHTTNGGVTLTAPAGNVVALDSSTHGRTCVVLRKVARPSAGDTDPGTTSINNGSTAGALWGRMILAGADGNDPLGADGCVQDGGSGTSGVASAVPITERCRVIRCWMIRGAATTPGDPSPAITDHGGEWEGAANNTFGSDYGYRIYDCGTFEAGETVPSQTSAFGATRSWTCVTVCVKLYAPEDMIPQIITSGSVFGSGAGSVSINSTANLSGGNDAILNAGDYLFVAGTEQNGSPSGLSPSVISPGGLMDTRIGVGYRKATTATDFAATASASGIAFGCQLSWFVVRGLDPNNPYSIVELDQTSATPAAPDATAIRSTDISVGIGISAGNVASVSLNNTSGITIASGGGNLSGRRHSHSFFIRDGLTPGTIVGPAWTHPGTVPVRAHHLMLHAAPFINLIEATFEIDLGSLEAIADTFPGAVFAEPEVMDIQVNMSAIVKSSRRTYLYPYRPLVWVYGFDGEKVSVFD